MSQPERLAKISHYLKTRHFVDRAFLLEELQIKPSSLKRDLAFMRDRWNWPIVFDRTLGGWRLDQQSAAAGPMYELPSVLANADEAHALLTIQHLLDRLDEGGLIRDQLGPLRERLDAILGNNPNDAAQLARRIRILPMASRPLPLPHFRTLADAVLQRRRASITHLNRATGQTTEREVSPQRLIHYRDNWYLDTWCHLRQALRSFAVDAIAQARLLATPAKDIDDAELDRALAAGYGIFAGANVQWARLQFSAERARWVAAERWHPEQRGQMQANGSYLLELPYSDPRELVMDILRHVPEVQILAPESLRQAVRERLQKGLERA
jgi:predicted DNA-binding transcriptional regulator YafY